MQLRFLSILLLLSNDDVLAGDVDSSFFTSAWREIELVRVGTRICYYFDNGADELIAAIKKFNFQFTFIFSYYMNFIFVKVIYVI